MSQPLHATVYRLDPLQDPRWQALVSVHARASVFHTVGWLQALYRTYGYRPIVYTTSPPASELKNGIVFSFVRSWLTGRRIVSLPFSDHCDPLCEDAEELRFLMKHVETDLKRERWKHIEIRPKNGILTQAVTESGFQQTSSYRWHRLSLENGLAEIFASLDKSCVQRRIRRAERAGLVEACGRSKELLRAFYDLLVVTRKRHQLPPQPYAWFRNIVECLGDAAEIRLASTSNGIPIAGIMILRLNRSVVYKYGASKKEFNHFGAMPLLLWRAIQAAKAAGVTELDLGRSDEGNEGLIAFKDRWSNDSAPLVYCQFPPGTLLPSAANWRLRWAKRMFARMPNGLLTVTGRTVYRHVG